MNLLVCEGKIPIEKCKELIKKYEPHGIFVEDTEYSVYYRHDFKSHELTNEILQYLPQFIGHKVSIRWYFTKYESGGFINDHTDGHVNIGSQSSTHTLLIYLNDDYKGGELNIKNIGSFHPSSGTVIIMNSDLLHNVNPVISGNKYLLRSDIIHK